MTGHSRWALISGLVLQGAALASACGKTDSSGPGGHAGSAGRADAGAAGEATGGAGADDAGGQAGDTNAAGEAGALGDAGAPSIAGSSGMDGGGSRGIGGSSGMGGGGSGGIGGSSSGMGGSSSGMGGSGSSGTGGIGDAPSPVVVELAAGDYHACALFSDGAVKCWGDSSVGQLGYGNKVTIGDDEKPSAVGFVSITTTPGVTVKHIKARGSHTCALLSDGTLKCWGSYDDGELGYGNLNNIGDNESPSSVGPVSVSSDPTLTVTDFGMGEFNTCAILSNGTLKCWGAAEVIGLGNVQNVGDDELPSSMPAVTIPGGLKVLQVTSGYDHTCALLADHTVHCWGLGKFLGYGNDNNTYTPSPQAVSLTTLAGVTVAQIDAHGWFSCARLSDGTDTCWGLNGNGQLGRGNTNTIGDDELPSSLGGPISISSNPSLSVTQVAVGNFHACALLSDGSLKCWGVEDGLGPAYYPQAVGVTQVPAAFPAISVTNQVGVTVTQVVAGEDYTCALLSDHSVKCWGHGTNGILGQGNTISIGESNNVPSDVPPIDL